MSDSDMMLTGAQAIAQTLAEDGVKIVFAYPGTSELAICADLANQGITLINSRGDKEAVFMAAGANRLRGRHSVAVLHGARGLTNALGAISDVRRSEIPVLCLVGTASRHSAGYLPPHAEPGLIASASRFASHAVDFGDIVAWDHRQFTTLLQDGLRPVAGPSLLGLPQDLAEAAFVPGGTTSARAVPAPSMPSDLSRANALIRAARRPVVMIDDYLLTDDGAAESRLGDFARRLGAPVYQVSYRRGPMLFQQATTSRVPTLAGLYDPADPTHKTVLNQADLLITVEDRNMYPRVVGQLPSCLKIVISSSPRASLKNGYTDTSTVVLEGSPPDILESLIAALPGQTMFRRPSDAGEPSRHQRADTGGQQLVAAIAAALATVPAPVLVDDSQSFGALIARHYSHLPASIRVLGSHGGFVGSGLATAVGAAIAGRQVLCLLGDQGFTNGVQALATAAEADTGPAIIVCNNGSSQSLSLQAQADQLLFCGSHGTSLLRNAPGMSYTGIASGYGIATHRLRWPCLHADTETDTTTADTALLEQVAAQLTGLLKQALTSRQPCVIELVMCECPVFWSSLWHTHGADETGS